MRLHPIAAAVLAARVLPAGPASAAAPDRQHLVTDPKPTQICGIQATVLYVVNEVVRVTEAGGLQGDRDWPVDVHGRERLQRHRHVG